MTKKLGTSIIVGFNVKSATPIDTRDVAETIVEMEAIENPYDGMKTYCLEDDTLYIYRDGKYKPYGGGSSVSSAFTYTLPALLSASSQSEEDFLTR